MEKISIWWGVKGKLLVAKTVLILLFINPILRQVDILKPYTLGSDYYFVLVASALFLMLQLMMTLLRPPGSNIVKLNTGDTAFIEKIKIAKKVDLMISSSESFYIHLKDALVSTKTDIRIIFRNPYVNEPNQKAKLKIYREKWDALKESNPLLKLGYRYSNNTTLRLIIIDQKELYFGFYKYDGQKFSGHDTGMIHVMSDSELGEYLLDIAINRFEITWKNSTKQITDRNAFI
ncbi:hypothetical protein [Zunongwangia profunda]|uniref:hypothetical protein n=1 Tax=Zunongwangia profunda TaxID=398743 RepID=UPI0030D73050